MIRILLTLTLLSKKVESQEGLKQVTGVVAIATAIIK
jgi:hypothetical protein